jgi:hypothetical protein
VWAHDQRDDCEAFASHESIQYVYMPHMQVAAIHAANGGTTLPGLQLPSLADLLGLGRSDDEDSAAHRSWFGRLFEQVSEVAAWTLGFSSK